MSEAFNWEAYDRVWRIGVGLTVLFVVLAIANYVLRASHEDPFVEEDGLKVTQASTSG